MAHWLNLSDAVRVNATKYPERPALSDSCRSFTWREVDERVDRLGQALLGMGLAKGDKVAILLENCIEFIELYMATARTGTVAVPVNFRLVADEVAYVAAHSEAKAFFVHDMFLRSVLPVQGKLPGIPEENYVVVLGGQGSGVGGILSESRLSEYESLLASVPTCDPGVRVEPRDTWMILYTSGTTGVPKGVVRSHESYTAFYLINAVDFSFHEGDVCLNVMPLCHVNSTFFTLNVSYVGGRVHVHPASRFEPEAVLETVAAEGITFISLVPTHYRMILSAQDPVREGLDLSSLKKLLCSSAPATVEMKQAVMRFFPGVALYEGYGSTEAGIVTVLKPHEQFLKPGSIGRESTGTSLIRILDENRRELDPGQVGELYSRSPMLFDEYFRMPEKTADSFCGEWFTARDMAYRDEDGYYFLVDRKDNMIISGGEKVFPSEVEAVLLSHPAIFDAAVIGLADEKWGEVVTAVVIPKEGCTPPPEAELTEFCRGRVAGFKLPRKVIYIAADEMPRTPTGKILHRHLRSRLK